MYVHLLTEAEVAGVLGKSTITLARWRREGTAPKTCALAARRDTRGKRSRPS